MLRKAQLHGRLGTHGCRGGLLRQRHLLPAQPRGGCRPACTFKKSLNSCALGWFTELCGLLLGGAGSLMVCLASPGIFSTPAHMASGSCRAACTIYTM